MQNWKSILTTVLGLIGGALVALGVFSQDVVTGLTESVLAVAGGIAAIVAFIVDLLDKDETSELIANKVVQKMKP